MKTVFYISSVAFEKLMLQGQRTMVLQMGGQGLYIVGIKQDINDSACLETLERLVRSCELPDDQRVSLFD